MATQIRGYLIQRTLRLGLDRPRIAVRAEKLLRQEIYSGDGGGLTEAEANDLYFQLTARFAELDTPEKKVTARQNLELQYIDGGTF